MNPTAIDTLLTALSTALLHSLWLFVVLVGLGNLLASWLPTARQRYTALVVTLFSLPLAFGLLLVTAWHALTGSGAETLSGGADSLTTVPALLGENMPTSGLSIAGGWQEQLATAYLCGLTVFLVIRLVQYLMSRRLRIGGRPPEPEWLGRFDRLRHDVVPRQRVQWKLSARVRQVLVVGVFRPVILFPLGLLAALAPDEVEAILLHELHHVRRRDALWHAVQLLVVSLFFYHPMVYWLSRRIDREREYVCDDDTSAATDPTTYARALVRVAKFSLHPKLPYAMSAVDNRTFTHRIHRLFGKADPTGVSRSSLLLPLILLPFCMLLAFAPSGSNAPGSSSESRAVLPSESSTLLGTVTDAETGEPLIGASIIVQNTNVGTTTDFDGNFTLRLEEGQDRIVISYVGYQTSIQSTELHQEADRPLAIQLLKEGRTGVKRGAELSVSESVVEAGFGGKSATDGLPDNLLILLDGRRIERAAMQELAPATIAKIIVVKDKDKLEALGHGTDFSGALLVTTRE